MVDQKSAPEVPYDRIGTQLKAVQQRYDLHGEYVVSRGGDSWLVDTIPHDPSDAEIRRYGLLRALTAPRLWRWASVTKQVVAVLVMQEVAAGRIGLDRPVSVYLPGFRSPNASLVTVRQLLRHQSGLPNPDNTAKGADGMPSYYSATYRGSRNPLTGYCAGPVAGQPGGKWSYNNCDYIVVGALLEKVTGKPWQKLVEERIARPLKLTSLHAFPTSEITVSGTVGGKPEPSVDFTSYGASAGLYGSAKDLLSFDRALLAGKLLPPAQLAEMWDGKPELGSIALGQWSFKAPLSGCAGPVRIIERRGEIGGVQVRNFILPHQRTSLAVFTDRGGDDFPFGEVWQGQGFAYDLLSAAACPAPAN
ncbi:MULTISPECIES: serine hydrolase domain-containing protein [Sphingomonas]|uniref:serine hydrolase domain-containing protein n=1 Tax=Sphingomonas TaxID=13687 RepID=UPI0013B467EA|nr:MULTISPECIES: serine hydrolase domain-containing protein [Sphingomonas]